jgi:hypothetical protein
LILLLKTEAENTNLSALEPTISLTRGEHANHYTTDALSQMHTIEPCYLKLLLISRQKSVHSTRMPWLQLVYRGKIIEWNIYNIVIKVRLHSIVHNLVYKFETIYFRGT